MPRILRYDQQVGARGNLGPGPVAGGVDTARAVGALTAGLENLGAAMEAHREEEAAAWSAQTLAQAQADWTQTLLKRKQEAPLGAANFTPQLLNDFDEYSKKTIGLAPTRRTRQFMEQRFTALRGSLATDAIAFEAASANAHATDIAKKSIDSARSELQVRPDVFSERLAERAALISSMRLPAAAKQELTDYAMGSMSRDAVLGLIQRDPRGTLKFLNTQPGKTGVPSIEALTADDRIQMRNAAEAEVRRLEAEAKSRLTEAQQAMKDQLRDIGAAAQNGITVTNIPEAATLKALFGEYEGQQLYEGAQRAAGLSNKVATMHTLSTPELIKQASEAVPKQVQGAADQAQVASFIAGRTEAIVRQRAQDPAGYLVQYSPSVKEAWARFSQTQGPDQEAATENYLRAVRAERERLGIPGADVLPNVYAQAVADEINTAQTGEALATTIEREAERWGSAWPQVYGQLAPKMTDTALVIGSGIPRSAATALTSLAQMKDSELKALLPPSTKWTDVQSTVDSRLEDFQRSFPAEGARTYGAFREAATRLTVRYMQQGASRGDAASKAYQDLVGSQYQMADFRGVTIRTPVTIDADAVADGARLAVEGFAPQSDAIAVPPGAGLTAEDYIAQYTAYVREHGYWVTRPDGAGLRLYLDGGPVVAGGVPVERTWEELQALNAAAETKRIEAQRENARRRQEMR